MPTTVEHTIGTGGDFATVAAWLTATANPIADDSVYIGKLKSETHALSGFISISGNSDATRYRVLTYETAPYNILDDSGPKLTYTRAGSGTLITLGQFEQAIGFGLFETNSSAVKGRSIVALAGGGLIDGVTLVVTGNSSTTPEGDHNGFSGYSGAVIRNCLYIEVATSGWKDGYYLRQGGAAYNCVSYNATGDGFWHNYGGAVFTNCVSIGSGADDFSNIGGATPSYLVSSDATAAGTGSVTSSTAAACFEDAVNDDFRPKDGGPLDDTGADLSSTFTTDVTGATRTLWSIGAYDAPPAAAGVTAHIKKNLSTTEYIPAHFAFSAWDSTVVSGGIHEALVKWTVSGGSEHDGVYYGHNLGFGWTTAGTFTVQLDITDAGGNTGTASTTVTVATPTYDNEIYVSSAGSDSNDGLTSGSPKLTVGAAWTALKAAHGAGEHSVIWLNRGDTFTETAASSTPTIETPASGSGTFYFLAYGTGNRPLVIRQGSNGLLMSNVTQTGREFGIRKNGIHFRNDTVNYVVSVTNDDSAGMEAGYDFVAIDTVWQTTAGSGFYLLEKFATGVRDVTTYPDEPGFSTIGGFCAQSCELIAYSRPTDGSFYAIWGGGRWFSLTDCDIYHEDFGPSPTTEYQHLIRCVWAQFHQYRSCRMHCRSSYGDMVRWQVGGLTLSPWVVSNRNTIVDCALTSSGYRLLNLSYVSSEIESIAGDAKHQCYISVLNNKLAEDSEYPPDITNWIAISAGGDAVAIVNNTLHASTTRPYFFSVDSPKVVTKGTERILIANNSIDIGTTTGSVTRIGDTGWVDAYAVLTFSNNASSGSLRLFDSDPSVAALVAANLTTDNNVADCTYWSTNIGEAGNKTLAQWQSYSSQDANSSTSSPAFADPANDDWSIGVDSPCYDAGATIVASTITREGTERSGTWDIGAFELGGSSITITPDPATATGGTAGPFVSTGGSGSGGTRGRRRRSTIAATAHRT